ncbi:MAG: CIA30 family protein [Polyangiaceae bacterium]|nr:CIA30 family protein [Polyangiaceae bacterium]
MLPAAVHACNVYTEDLLRGSDPANPERGGTGGIAEAVGGTAGRGAAGGLGGIGTGGTRDGSGGAVAVGGASTSGGSDGSGGESTGGGGTGGQSGGGESTGGSTTGGTTTGGASGGTGTGGAGGEAAGNGSGGAPTGGDSPGGATTGGAATGGVSAGGAAGADTGGAPTGGAPTGGVSTGGVSTGGVSTGGVSTGGVSTGGLPAGITAIDMLDEVNNAIELKDGEGLWYVFHDDSADGVISPDTPRDPTVELIPVALPTPRDGSLLGVHVVANDGFTTWGAGVGFNLNSPEPTTRLEYDVSSYTGIVLWARADTGTLTLRLKVVTADISSDTQPGGECTANCNDAFGHAIDLTSAWQEYSVPFSELTQQGWGYRPPNGFDPTGVLTVQLHVDPGVAFDVWLDDVRFYD